MPNLRCLSGDFLSFSSSVMHLLRLLLGPRLQDISIDTSSSAGERMFLQRTALHVVLRTLHSCCPYLENFRCGTYSSTWDAHTARAASYSIQRLQKLRIVAVPAITKDALAHLGGLPCLTSLSTYLPTGSDLGDVFRSSLAPFPFENLRSVEWEIEDWADVEVFTRLWSHKLTKLSLRSKVHFDPGLLQILFESFHTREAFQYLQSIHFTQSSGCHNPTPGVTLPGLVEFIELYPRLTILCIGSVTLAGVDVDSDEDLHMDNVEPCRSRTLEHLTLTYPHAQERYDDIMWRERLENFLGTLFPSPYLSFAPEDERA